MRTWLLLLSGLIIWTVHFFGIYIAASFFPGTNLAKWLTGLLTFVALGLLAASMYSVRVRTTALKSGSLSHWLHSLAFLSGAISCVAVLYQGLPALTA
jgi:hypothetical protein